MNNEIERPRVDSVHTDDPWVMVFNFSQDIQRYAKLGLINFDTDLNGHCGSRVTGHEWLHDHAESPLGPYLSAFCFSPSFTREDIQKLGIAMEKGEILDEFITIGSNNLHCCGECGEQMIAEFNGRDFRIANPCEFPDGCYPFTFKIEIPSGKVFVCNDMRKLWKDVEEITDKNRFDVGRDTFNVNHNIGCRNTTEAYASFGMAHVFVGNSSPDVVIDDGKIIVGSPVYIYDEDSDEDEVKVPIEGKKVCYVCTDLWWYCMADYEEVLRRWESLPEDEKTRWGNKYDNPIDCFFGTVFEIPPGTYEFRVEPINREFNDKPTIYSTARRIS